MPEDTLELLMGMLTGKDEIYFLITRVIKKMEDDGQQKLNLNTNRDNYTPIARELSAISNQLPFTSESKQHQVYEAPDEDAATRAYPYRKYDITGGQIRDVYMGLVKKPRPYLVDACYIYLYGVGRQGFEKNPIEDMPLVIPGSTQDNSPLQHPQLRSSRKYLVVMIAFLLVAGISSWMLLSGKSESSISRWTSYKPSPDEIKQLVGIWQYQTGAPQARGNEENRYRRIATNMIQIQHDGKEFSLKRYGASINHYGYLEFTSPGVLSIHSFVGKAADGSLTNPSHSLAKISPEDHVMYAISTTWSFESDDNNDIIGARNIYTKLGDEGTLREISNTPENAACHCKIVEWAKSDGSLERFNLTYNDITPGSVEEDLDEKSLILREPKSGVLLSGSKPAPVVSPLTGQAPIDGN